MSANKLSKTYSRPSGDGGGRPLLRTGEAPGGMLCLCPCEGTPTASWNCPRQGGSSREAPRARRLHPTRAWLSRL